MTRLGRILADHPWIVYAVLAVLSYPILEIILHGENAIQYAHDVFDDDIPRLFSIAADWSANGPVLWDPHLTAGNALMAQFALPPLAPDVLLSFVLPPFTAYTLNAVFMAFAAGVSMHLFLRDSLRLATVACFVGGILATFAFWHYIYGYAALLLPLLLWSIDRVSAVGRRRRDVLFAILLVAFLLFSSQIQIVLIDGVVVFIWVLLGGADERPRVIRVANLIAVWGIAFVLAAPVLASQVVAIPTSQRTIWDLASGFPVLEQIRHAVGLYGRTLLGVPVRVGVGGSADIYGTFFLGALALPLLVIGIVAPRRTGRQWFLLVLLVIIPLIDILAPLFVPIQAEVGILRSFQFVRVRHLFPVILAINAAIGAGWLAGPDPIGRLSRARRLLAGIGFVGVGFALAWQVSVAVRKVAAGTGTEIRQEGWLLGLVALAGGSIIALGLAIAIWGRLRRRGGGAAWLVGGIAIVLLIALAGERLAMTRTQRDLGVASFHGSWADRVELTPAQEFIAAQPGGGRVLSMGEHANRALVAGLDTVDGYETIYPLRYHELFGAMIEPQLATDPFHDHYFNTWGNRAYAFGPQLDMGVADLLGVRWLYVVGAPLTDPSLTPRFSGGGVTVYENPAAFPRAFVAHHPVVVADRAAIATALDASSLRDLRDRVYLAATDLPSGGAPLPGLDGAEAVDPGGDSATIETDRIDTIGIRTRAASPGILVLADTWTSDWAADVDGVTTPVLPIDGALRGVALPAGDHLVTFSYRPIATYLGIALALIAALALIGWLAFGWIRRDRSAVSVAASTPRDATPPTSVSPSDRASGPPS